MQFKVARPPDPNHTARAYSFGLQEYGDGIAPVIQLLISKCLLLEYQCSMMCMFLHRL